MVRISSLKPWPISAEDKLKEEVDMKKLVPFVLLVSLLATVSCSSSKKDEEEDEPSEPQEARTFKLDYEVVDASDKVIPDWIKSPAKVNKVEERKDYRYFVNESSNVNQRLCEKSAEARASAQVASEITQFIKNSYAEATQGGENEEVTSYVQEQLAQETQAFVVGASVVKKYWEKRSYKEALGATKNEVKFYCYAVVRMAKKDVEKAVEMARAKLLQSIKAPEVKKKTEDALKETAKKFSELDEKVEVESKQ